MTFIIYYILIFVLGAHGLPRNRAKVANCLILTPEVQDQINDITNTIAKFITDISVKYDNIDLRLININVDKHSAQETNKTTVFKVNINDCSTNYTHTQYKTNNNYKPKEARNENVKSIPDSIDFDDLDDDGLESQATSDNYSFIGDTEFISADNDNEYVMNYERNVDVDEENNTTKLLYYYNFNDLKNDNVTYEKIVNVFE